MADITVDARKNVYVVPGGWNSIFNPSAQMLIEPGTYEIRIKSGSFSFWSSGPKEEPMVFLIFNGGFRSPKTGIPTSFTWVTLNGLEDKLVIEVTAQTKLYASFIDVNTGDNRGVITLSCNPLP